MRFAIPHVIYDAELPDNLAQATALINSDRPITLFANKLTPELRELSKNPNVQLRFSDSSIKID